MSRPKVFVSSAYINLERLREELYKFISERGYEPVMFEKGGIYFDPTKPLDESCYEAAKEADIFILVIGGRYGSPSSKERRKKAWHKQFNSITRMEYISARDAGIPIYTFVDEHVLSDFATWLKNPDNRGEVQFAHVDHQGIFELISEIYSLHKNNLVTKYTAVEHITNHLNDQLAHIVHDYVDLKRSARGKPGKVPINSYKLFFYRSHKGLSFTDLAKKSNLDRTLLRRLEIINRDAEPLAISSFPKCEPEVVRKLEDTLGCNNRLTVGLNDDFLSAYISYYAVEKGLIHKPRSESYPVDLFPVKAIIFDFDGTLTSRADDETTWEKIWKSLGYHINDCAKYHRQFSDHKITHEQWCEITCEKFKDKRLSEDNLLEIARSIKLVPNTGEVLRNLYNKRIKIYILSGSIKFVIRTVLGGLTNLFEDIKANDLVFGSDGIIDHIYGTKYDFEGKADFIKSVVKDNRFNPLEVLFIGNSCNDVYASESGVRTLCVNPRFTNPDNMQHWTHCIRQMDRLDQILEYTGFNQLSEVELPLT